MLEPPQVTEVLELAETLNSIGLLKDGLPLRLRGWVNTAGLYVQHRTAGDKIRTEAGGKYKSYVVIEGSYDKYGDRKIRRYDKKTWLERFSHLVYPTFEIALFLSGSPFETAGSRFDENAANILKEVVQHFDMTGEWLGLIHKKCVSCSREVTIWELQKHSCPHCGGKMGALWEEEESSES